MYRGTCTNLNARTVGRRRRAKRRRVASLVLACATGSVGTRWATAANGAWKVNAGGVWSNPANWTSAPAIPNGIGDVATFGSNITGDRTYTVDGSFVLGTLRIDTPTTSTIAGTAPNGLTFSVVSGDALLQVDRASVSGHTISSPLRLESHLSIVNAATSSLKLTRVLSGPGGIAVSGNVDLSGQNTYFGPTSISGGTLLASGPAALGDLSGGPITINAGGTLRLTENLSTKPVFLNGGMITGRTFTRVSSNISIESASAIGDGGYSGVISGNGGLSLGSEFLSLSGANTFTGVAEVLSGNVEVKSPMALGDSSSGTIVRGGDLNLTVPTPEPIHIAGGILSLGGGVPNAPVQTFENDLSAAAGRVTASPAGAGAVLTKPLLLTGSGSVQIGAGANSVLTLKAGVTGSNDIVFGGSGTGSGHSDSGQVNLDAPLTHTGSTTLARGTLKVNVAAPFPGPITVTDGTLNFATDSTVSTLVLRGGLLRTEPGKALTVSNQLVLQGGQVDADLAGPAINGIVVEKNITFARIGAGFTGPVTVNAGQLTVGGQYGLGSPATGTVVASSRGAVLSLNAFGAIDEPIQLNNAHGNGLGGLVGGTTLNGSLDLGTIGSGVGTTTDGAILVLAGPIGGGALTIHGVGQSGSGSTRRGGFVRIAGGHNSYTGATTIEPDGMLELVSAGRLSTTSRIDVYGDLRVQGFQANDLIADSVPVRLHGGTLLLDTGGAGESLGVLDVHPGGRSEILFEGNSLTQQITLGKLTRQKGGLLDLRAVYNQNFDRTDRIGTDYRINVQETPDLRSGILPWAVTANQFVTYGANGLTRYAPNRNRVTGSISTDNVDLTTSDTLTADHTINSLRLTSGFDLGGRTLTIASGGVLGASTSNITNGRLRPGPDGELILWGGTVSADIADALDAPSSVVIADNVTLSGNNTYTGATVLSRGQLAIRGAGALPAGTTVINGMALYFDLPQNATFALGDYVTVDSGTVGTSGKVVTLNARSYSVDWGTFGVNLTGNGPMTKTSRKTFTISTSNPTYAGTIDVMEGTLSIEGANGTGTGLLRVHPGGVVLANAGTSSNPIQLLGGRLDWNFRGSADDIFNGPIDVVVDSTIGASRNLTGTLTVPAGVRLSVDTSPSFVGDVRIDGRIFGASGRARLTPRGGKSVTGGGTADADLIMQSGGVVAPGNGVGILGATNAQFAPEGVYSFEISDADAGPGVGWDLLSLSGALTITSGSSGSPFKVKVVGLDASGLPGPVEDFDRTRLYSWPIVSAGSVTGFEPGRFTLDLAEFVLQNPADGTFGVGMTGTTLSLNYAPAPLGDTDFDRHITADDYWRLDEGFLNRRSDYLDGDFNWDGRIDLDDYARIDASYLAQSFASSATVPEPAAAISAICLSSLLLHRRRSLAQKGLRR